MAWRWAFDLVTTVSSRRGRVRASANAKRMMRVTPARVMTETSVATSSGSPRCTRPPTPAYSPSEFSRTITQSSSRAVTPRNGLAIHERALFGRYGSISAFGSEYSRRVCRRKRK